MAQPGSRNDGDLGSEGGSGAGVGGVGAENVVEHVEDAIGEKDVLLQDAGRVDEVRIGRESDGDGPPLQGLQLGPVNENITVTDPMGAVDDVVFEQVRQLLHGQAGKSGAKILEGGVVRREDGDVVLRVDVRRQRGVGDCTARRGEVERRACACEVDGWDEEGVNGVDDPAFEGDVLGLRTVQIRVLDEKRRCFQRGRGRGDSIRLQPQSFSIRSH